MSALRESSVERAFPTRFDDGLQGPFEPKEDKAVTTSADRARMNTYDMEFFHGATFGDMRTTRPFIPGLPRGCIS